jgi:ABC-type cobalamin/Fe3+-siderophores transport system ATPase subunit
VSRVTPLIAIQHLVVMYREWTAVEDVSLAVPAGSITAVIGPNGAGKTSLIRAASGVLPIQAGAIRLSGRALSDLKPPERARLVAVVPQARALPEAFTARELVSAGRTPWMNWLGQASPRDELAIQTAMQRTETVELGERRVGELSGGEQQRLLLARALAQNAPLLMLDEPSAHLDLRYQIELLDLIRGLVDELNLGVLVALHDLNLVARIADQVVLLVDGKLKATGSVEAVLQPDLLSEAYGIPLTVLKAGRSRQPIILPS